MKLSAQLIVLAGLVLGTGGCAAAHPATLVTHDAATATPRPPSATERPCSHTSLQANQGVDIDWVDFVQLNHVQYLAGLDGQIPAPPAADIGGVVGTVHCELSNLANNRVPGPPTDGDAAFLPVGTQLRTVRGFAPSCRLVARIDGQYRVYLAHHDVANHSVALSCAKASARG